ncbi:hypothetical protein C8R43DRAFT_888910 [Mycena crocata]|nr:hypothetical protein C8R43DRAFT_888910 [Mycena crocata]
MSDNFARCLFAKGHRFPLFHLKPFDNVPELARQSGTQIGDVGFVTQDGSFDTCFNILLDANDPANRFGVSAGFKPVALPHDNIRMRERQHPPGAILSNKTVNKGGTKVEASLEADVQVHHSVLLNSSLFPIGVGAAVEISAHSKQTGLLILLNGASSWDTHSQQILSDYAVKHAQSWYVFVNGPLHRMIGNDGLYLISGVTKSTSWCIASLEDSSGGGQVSLRLKGASG